MGEFEEKMNAILGNKEAMGQIMALAQSLGGRLLTLGPRILRTETAPLAALAAILYEKGDMERRGEPV